MQKAFRKIEDVLDSELLMSLSGRKTAKQQTDRVLKSTWLENLTYPDLHKDDTDGRPLVAKCGTNF